MSRAHMFGYDTNPAQFERMGNPWVTRREQQELGNSPISRAEQRANRKAKPHNPAYRDPPRKGRDLSPEEKRAKRHRDTLQLIRNLDRQARGKPVREETGWKPAEQLINLHRPAAQSELTGWQRFERQCVRVKQRAEVAERCRKAEIEDEKARLKAMIAAAKERLAILG